MKKVKWYYATESQFNNIPENAGVYLITITCGGGDKKEDFVIYSGQSTNIAKRCKEHWSDSESNDDLKNIIKKYNNLLKVYYCFVETSELDGCEKFLFEHYLPQLQQRKPDAELIEISLPPEPKIGNVNF